MTEKHLEKAKNNRIEKAHLEHHLSSLEAEVVEIKERDSRDTPLCTNTTSRRVSFKKEFFHFDEFICVYRAAVHKRMVELDKEFESL